MWLTISWILGCFYIISTKGIRTKLYSLENIKFILFVAPIFTPIVLTVMGIFYIFLGLLNLLEKMDTLQDK